VAAFLPRSVDGARPGTVDLEALVEVVREVMS
jgi:hypothetical protein